MKNKISIIQGRTIPSENKEIQTFPFKNWLSEFENLQELKIRKLQWIYENSYSKKNPLIFPKFLKKISYIRSKHNVYVNSVCADEFIRKPLIKRKGLNSKAIDDLIKLLTILKNYNIEYIVVPFIDKSSIKNFNYEKYLFEFLKLIYPIVKAINMEIHIESDIENKKIATIINLLKFSKHIKINFDSGNTVSLGFDLKKEIVESFGLIGSVHIKDRIIGGSTVPLGYGNVDFDILFKTLKKINYKGEFVIQGSRINGVNDKFLIYKYLKFLKKYI